MITAIVDKENCKHLIPHKIFHKFIETDEVFPIGTELTGNKVEVKGRIYGKTRIYSLFQTSNRKLLDTQFLKFN